MPVLTMMVEEHLELADWSPDEMELAVGRDIDLPPLPAVRAAVEMAEMSVFW
ncbi:hypothetical protein OZX57_06440 [Bifidobacterium sp. ESL0682]|uniref:hypothetical protein n=1 Tax=Bifidobacterium sp. ESL0682 TaxID=2983212 RepID=UPI0023F6244C|nr:hypothetical protein [Bifidobacterium sp. ESL0682]WEV41624.1 hypothetical protein OZX57_06440 [Bifidobacterium sp. ESL0682]